MKTHSKFPIILTISIIGIIGFSLTASAQSSTIPDWVKNNAKWWSEGSISEADYVKSLEYMITNGIINIPIPIQIAEVTAAQNLVSDDERAQNFIVHFSDGLLPEKFTVTTFAKFEMTSSVNLANEPYTFSTYKFGDTPEFLLEGLPSIDKKLFYEGINRWLNENTLLEPFDVDVDVVAGDGTIIHTWAFVDCKPNAFGTYLQDVKFYYQLVEEDVPEIRERATFECRGVDLEVP